MSYLRFGAMIATSTIVMLVLMYLNTSAWEHVFFSETRTQEVEINHHSLAYEGSMWLDYLMPRWLTYTIYLALIIVPPALSRYRHMRHFALTLVAVIVVDIILLNYAVISFFCLLAGLATLHLVYIILTNKCAEECPELFPDWAGAGPK